MEQYKMVMETLEGMGIEYQLVEHPPGVVSIFGLLNNRDKDVNVIIDQEILTEDRMSFHVNDNTKTAFIATGICCGSSKRPDLSTGR